MASEADARARAGVEAIFERYFKLAEKKAGDVRNTPMALHSSIMK